MRILSLEIRRNVCGYTLTMLGQVVENQAIVGQVRVANDQGAEITLPLSPVQIDAALAAIAGDAAADANALVSALTPPSFGARPALEHAPAVAPWVPGAPHAGLTPVVELAEDGAPVDPLVFEAGKRYRTRDGAEVEVVEVEGDPEFNYPVRGRFAGSNDSDEPQGWTQAGRYYSEMESAHDLVAEIHADALA